MGQQRMGKNADLSGMARMVVGASPAVMVMIFGLVLVSCFSPSRSEAAGELLNHNSVNTATGKYGSWGTTYTCTTCHARTATTNIKKVKTSIITPTGARPVVFTRITTSQNNLTGIMGNDERTVYANGSRNVCEVCHHRTIYHNYSSGKLSSLSHPEHKSNRKDCGTCHKHSLGFRPPQAGACVDCHGTPPTNPGQLVTNALGATPPPDAGAHNRHRNLEGMECHTCHNNYGHGLLGNDKIEMGFKIDRTTWSGFTGTVTTGTFTGTIGGGFNDDYAVSPDNPGTILLRETGKTTCSIYCHGENWSIGSGKDPAKTPISWTNGPLGDCSNAVCHGTTPSRPPTPSVATGAHQRHVGSNQYACTTCHDDYPNPHMVNGHVKWNLSSLSTSATYKGFTIHSTATLATTGAYGSCATVYCHSDVQSGATGNAQANSYQTVTWGGALIGCDGCHGGRKTDATPIATGNHAKHLTTYAYVCGDCHAEAGKDNEAKHGDKNIDVTFSAIYGGSYSQAINPPGDGYGDCSANYCHSDGKGTTKSVSWGGAPLNCTACHKADLASGTPVDSGKHTAHINNASVLGTNYGCADCHLSTVSGNSTVSSTGRHVNTFADYSGVKAGRYTAATGACSASYCHSDGKGRQNVTFDAGNGWNSAAQLDCKGCHGNDTAPTFTSAAGEPNYANTGANQIRSNSHERHMGGVGGTTCVYCHNDTMTSVGTLISGAVTHTNGSIEVAAGGGKAFTWTKDSKTCSDINCHGTGSVAAQWGQAFPVDCTGCHGNNAVSANPISTNKHGAHVNNKSVLGVNYGCAFCHALTAGSNDRSIVDTSVHGNGFKNYTGSLAGGRNGYTTATGVCAASYCHSDGKGVQNVPFDATNGWKSSALIDCKGCHGNSTPADFASVAGEPNYASTGAGAARANSHKNHVDSGVASCVFCHGATVTAEGAIIQDSTTHILDKAIDVVPGGGKSFVYGTGKTCSDISCHGGRGSYTQTWGAPGTLDCTGCHGNNTASSSPIASGRHTAHINNPDLGANYSCTDCHAKTINADERTFANSAFHGNGFIDYSGVRAGKSATYDPGTGACSATYCHTDGKGRQNVAFDLSNGWKSPVIYTDCKGCHGNDPAADFTSVAGEPNYASTGGGEPRANSHKLHVGAAGAATCVYCHGTTVTTAGTAIVGNHTNRSIEVQQGGGKTFTPEAGKSCSNISCHGAGSPSATWGASFPADCTGCHGGNAASANPIGSGKHSQHVYNAGLIGINLACADCHANTVITDTSIGTPANHATGFPNYSGARAGKNKAACNAAYCHSDGKGGPGVAVDWVSGPAFNNCIGCHGTATGTGTFASQAGEPNYANAGAGVFKSNSHQSHTTSGAASCDTCHVSTVTTSGTSIRATGLHLNGTLEVEFNTTKAGATATYTAESRTCNNISCHGGGSPRWGDAASAGCKTCHASLGGMHAIHVNDLMSGGTVTFYNFTANRSSGTLYRFGCATCHPTDPLRHRNGQVDVTFNRNKSGAGYLVTLNNLVDTDLAGYTKGGASNFTCETVYCHSNGRTLSLDVGDYRQTPNWYGGSFGANRCGGCHDNPPQYAGQSHYVAQSSMGNNGSPPYKESGHMIGIHYRNNSRGGTKSGFLGFSSSGSMAHGNPALVSTISCATCHTGIVSATQIDTYAMAGTGSTFRCATCHTSGSRTPLQPGQIVNTALHVNGTKNVAFAPITFKTKAQLANVANALGWTRNGTYKADDSYDSFELSVSTWDAQTKTCLTACHVNQPDITWGAQLKCFSCHANQ